MKLIRLIGLALIAVFAVGALSASSAFAEPEISPAGTKEAPVEFKATSNGEVTLESTSGKKLTCKSAEGNGSFTTASTGTELVTFKECKSGSANCNSPGDAAGVILAEYQMRLVSVLPGGTLDLGIWLEPEEHSPGTGMLTFTCGLIFKAKLLGSLIAVVDNRAGALLKLNEPGEEVKVLWKGAKGEQEIKECDTPEAFCKGKKFLLETEFVSGTHELTAELADATLIFSKTIEFKGF